MKDAVQLDMYHRDGDLIEMGLRYALPMGFLNMCDLIRYLCVPGDHGYPKLDRHTGEQKEFCTKSSLTLGNLMSAFDNNMKPVKWFRGEGGYFLLHMGYRSEPGAEMPFFLMPFRMHLFDKKSILYLLTEDRPSSDFPIHLGVDEM